jgi:hypothetical protein
MKAIGSNNASRPTLHAADLLRRCAAPQTADAHVSLRGLPAVGS